MPDEHSASSNGARDKARDSNISVLIVEDHAMVAEGLAAAIGSEPDLEVAATAGTVDDAIKLARETRPDVALVDYRLPDGTGATATAGVKEASPDTQVVMLTAMEGDRVLGQAIEAGCSGFLRKTEPLEQVMSAVRCTAKGETYFSAEVMGKIVDTLRRPTRTIGSDLTPRELEVLSLLARGDSTEQIVSELVISTHTARNHVRNILTKLHAHSKLEAVAIAAREGIISFDPVE